MVKKISVYGEEYYILYIKNDTSFKKSKKSKESNNEDKNILSQLLPRYSHLNDLNVLEYIIGKDNILPYYQPSIEVTRPIFEQLEKVVSPALRSILYEFNLARAINIVYSSCQGEVDE